MNLLKLLLLSTLVVFSIHAGFSQRNIATFQAITATMAIDDKVFFAATHEQYGNELFVSDGSSGNFKLLKDLSQGYGSSSPSQLTVLNNQLFFTAYSSEYGLSIWKSDGTSAGTQLVYGVKNADPFNLMVFKGKLYFTTNLGSIIRTDGTPGGTEVFYQSEVTYGRISTVVKNDQYIYFTSAGRTIYRDDGTSRIDFFGPLSWEDVYFRNLFVVENTLVVIKSSSYDNVIRIYSISNDVLGDQVEDEWLLIKKLDAPTYGRQEIENFTHVSGKLFFSFRTYYDNVKPTDELWICDGTEVGTKMVKSFDWFPHSYKSEMGMFFAFHEKLFFRGGDPANKALWTSDGTTDGTIKFHDVVIIPPYNDERAPVIVTENKIYFSGSALDAYNSDVELWSSNGTSQGTKQVFDLEDVGGSSPHDFSFSNDVLYFVTSQQFSATLWSTVPAADISITGTFNNVIKSGSSTSPFYNVALGACKKSDLKILNKGLGELYLRSIILTGKDFFLLKQSLPETIAPGESVTTQVVFNPVSDGKTEATLTILSSDQDESKYVIHLSATLDARAATEICQFESGFVKSLESNQPAKSITLLNSSIAEGQPVGSVIGAFSFPANATFTLVAGEGDIDNKDFFIIGNQLKSNTVFHFDSKNVCSLRVKAASPSGDVETSLRIHVINASPGFTGGLCQPAFERMSFSYTSLETNSEGYLFTTTSNGQILRSKDEGLSWEVVYSSNYSRLSKLTFKGKAGYAWGSHILKSDDGGATWFKLYIPLSSEYYSSDLDIYFFNDKEGYIGTAAGEIFFTADGGRTWETRTKGSWGAFRHVYFMSKDKGYATVDWGDLLQTVDGGRSWSRIDLSGLGWNTRVQGLYFSNDQHGFLIGDSKFYKTSNGGNTWTEISTVYASGLMRIKFFDENMGFLFGQNGGLYKTTNGGEDWASIATGIWPAQTVGIAKASGKIFIANKNYYYSYDAARSLAVSSDDGATWSKLNSFNDGHVNQIDFSTGNKGIVISADGIFKTDDNGLTWHNAVSDLANVTDIHFIDDNTALLISGGNIYKSTDGGTTTRNVLTADQNLPAGKLYVFPGNILFAVSWSAIYRSNDLGETWEMVSLDPGYYTQGMHFISQAIGYRVELFGSVEKTNDGGKTWTEIFTRAPETSYAFNAVFFLNETIGYKGGEFLEQTMNGGISWKKVDWPFYEIIAIHFENEDHGYVVIRGGSVYETNNAGSTWETIFYGSNRLLDVQFVDHKIFLAGENGFVARMNTTPAPPALPGYIYGPNLVCAGDITEYHLAVNGDYRTQWSTTADDAEDHSGSVTINFPDAGEYIITAKHFNFCGLSESRTTTVMVAAPPATPVIEGSNPAPLGGQDITYKVANGREDYKFLWEVKGSSIAAPFKNQIVIDWASDAKDGEIKVLAVDSSGCRAYGTLAVALEVPVAIEDELQSHASIYPNPTGAETKISSSHEGLLYIRIMDTLGREYSRIIISGGEEQILSTRELPTGLYLVEISDGRHSITKKLIRK